MNIITGSNKDQFRKFYNTIEQRRYKILYSYFIDLIPELQIGIILKYYDSLNYKINADIINGKWLIWTTTEDGVKNMLVNHKNVVGSFDSRQEAYNSMFEKLNKTINEEQLSPPRVTS